MPASLLFEGQHRGYTLAPEEFLPRCAASIMACRHLLSGNELMIVKHLLSTYVPTLEALAQQPSRYQQAAAGLTAQAYRLKSLLAWHELHHPTSEAYGQKALHYARLSKDPNVLVATSMFYVTRDVEKTLHIYQEVLPYLAQVSPLLQSAASMASAWAYGQHQQEQEALRCRDKAREIFPEPPEKDASFPYAQFGHSSMLLWEALMYRGLSQHDQARKYQEEARDTFSLLATPSSTSPSSTLVPERIRIEAVNYLAELAVTQGDLHLSCDYLEQGARGAKALGSEKRRQEAVTIWRKARETWPDEQRVMKLADVFVDM